MTELLTAAQVRAIEQAAIDRGEVTGLELMERAGRGVVEAIFEEWPELAKSSHRAVVLCGPGNNGGDGFVVARLLKEWGWEVGVFLYGEGGELPPDAKANCQRWLEMGEVRPFSPVGPMVGDGVEIVVDALFGTGLSRPLKGDLKELILSYCPDGDLVPYLPSYPKFISIDLPTGFCSDSGKVMGAILPSHLTVTFQKGKIGQHLDACGAWSQKVIIKKIGLEGICLGAVRQLEGERQHFSTSAYLPQNWLGKDETNESHMHWPKGLNKFHHGHALILSGPATKTGAARLAARGALRIGAGLVTIGSPSNALAEHAAQLNAIMLTEIDNAVTLREVLKDKRITSLCLGPSMGLTDVTREMVEVALTSGKKCVLDADALTVFRDNPKELFDLLHENTVLTPHGGEFSRLFPDFSMRLNEIPTIGPAYSKVDATRDAAARAGCVVLFKGPDTVIADARGRAVINSAHYERAAPWLATAGSGDVLAGFVAGLMARGMDGMKAAESAAWLHVECALNFGAGLIAEDLPEQLPAVFRKLSV